jgi:hypothetical protein
MTRNRSEMLTEQQITIVGYLFDPSERSLPLPAHPSAPDKVSLVLVAQATGLAPKVLMKRANRELVDRWSDTLGVRPASDHGC